MALINIPTDHIKLRKTLSIEKKQLMLKDYLRDDLSSCSSSGFKSFPRRQCCTTVRFLLESDLNKSKGNYASTTKRLLKRKPGSTTISALQRGSKAVLNAVKLLPFPSIKSSSQSLRSNSSRKGHLPRSFPRKLFKRSFWRKANKEDHGEIQRWKLFREFLEEKNQPCDQNTITNAYTTDTSSTTMITSRVSKTTSRNSNSWAESEFTAEVLQSSGGNSERSSENGVDDNKTNLPEKRKGGNMEGVTVDEDSIPFAKDRPNEGGKEQCSPVSVLDCFFDDEEEEEEEEEEGNLTHVELEGIKQKLMRKTRMFESLTDQVEPVDLEKRITLAELEDESLESPKEEVYAVSLNNNGSMSDEEDNKQEKDREANEKLLKLLKAKIPLESDSNFKLKADNLLLDFFRERLLMVEDNNAKGVFDMGLEGLGLDIFKVAEDWDNGNPPEWVQGWEVQEGRKAYVKEMERNENWRDFNEEKEEMGLAVELEVFSLLVDELLTDIF